MLPNKTYEKQMLSRRKIVKNIIVILLLSECLGICIYQALRDVAGTTIGFVQVGSLLLFPLFTLACWLPFFVCSAQIYTMDEEGIVFLPPQTDRMKWKLILQVLCHDDVTPYLTTIYFKDIRKAIFDVDCHAGNWGYSRYSYVLKLYDTQKLIHTLYINPMENGFLLPSSHGGIAITGFKHNEDICNMLQFIETNDVLIQDPHHIIDAMKNKDIEIYDYLESLHLHKRY